MSLKGKKILLTGGSVLLGRALTKKLCHIYDVDTIRIFSRDEGKQVTMATEMTDHRLRFIIGDVRDRDRVIFAMEDIDVVFHVGVFEASPCSGI